MEEFENKMSDQEIERLIDLYFPKRSASNDPSYRKHQREAILSAAHALFNKGDKFVAMEGPTGSGKSAINFTLEKIAGPVSVYLTPLVILQDQMMKDDWHGLRCVKGRSNYYCSNFGVENTKYDCCYDGPVGITCNTGEKTFTPSDGDIAMISREVDQINLRYGGQDSILSSKTSFKNSEEFVDFLKLVQRDFDNAYNELVAMGTKSPKRKVAIREVCCDRGPHECPVKSSRLRLKYAEVAVLNPDIFYLMCKNEFSPFRHSKMMVIDECQQIEDFVGRIFKPRIPVQSLKEIFDIDIDFVGDKTTGEEIINKITKAIENELITMVAVGKMLKKFRKLLAVKNYQTLIDTPSEGNEIIQKFTYLYSHYLRSKFDKNIGWSFSFMGLLQAVFSGQKQLVDSDENIKFMSSFYDFIRPMFMDICDELKCGNVFTKYNKIANKIEQLLGRDEVSREAKKYFKPRDKDNEHHMAASHCMVQARSFIKFSNELKTIVDVVLDLNRLKEEVVDDCGNKSFQYPYLIKRGEEDRKTALSNFPSMVYLSKSLKKSDDEKERFIELVPINMGAIMNFFFYSQSEKVMLSSATWVFPDRLRRLYGLPGNCELVKVPTVFPIRNRPIFTFDHQNITDFSHWPREEETHFYKTYAGTIKFVNELYKIIGMLRQHILKRHGINSNIIVHCHTFDIAVKIAMWMPGMNRDIMIQIPENIISVKNELNGFDTLPRRKTDLIEYISRKENNNKGLTLISCSMSEGVDFNGDIAHGQIILKKPTPQIKDAYVMARMNGDIRTGTYADPYYFDSVVLTKMMQQYGRIVRDKSDWGYTVIIDKSIIDLLRKMLMKKNSGLRESANMEYFLEAVQYKIGAGGCPVFTWFPK